MHSEAWRSCDPGLLEAIESLPSATSLWESMDPFELNNTHELCAACNRRASHATRLVCFQGHPLTAEYQEANVASQWQDEAHAMRRLSRDYMKASKVYRERREVSER